MNCHGGTFSLYVRVITLKEYLETLATRPATLQKRERRRRLACTRCDGEVFVLYPKRDAVCAGCGALLKIPE